MANEKACDFCKGRAYTKKPVTIITAYGKRFQMVFEHCPNCGRKLRKEDCKFPHKETHFCSYGERRNNDDTESH